MRMIALIDYGSGNLHSAERALRKASVNAKKTREIRVTSDPDAILNADRIVLPGVGHFGDCIANLRAKDGLVEALEQAVLKQGKPFLGICVGMQMLADFGFEDGEHKGLGWVHGTVGQIEPGPGYHIPHMGWNSLNIAQNHPVLADLGDDPHAYFVHSYGLSAEDDGNIAAVTDYGYPLTAAVARDNIFGTQFHPEKSQRVGLQILSNWMLWNP